MDNITIVNNDFLFICERIAEPQGFEFPETRGIIEDIPARDGAIYIGSKFGRRSLSWQTLLKGTDVQSKRRDLIRACQVGSLKTILFETCDGIPLKAEIEIENLVMPHIQNRAIALVQAIAPDYRFYSQEAVTAYTGVTESVGGLPVPAAVPAPISGGVTNGFSVINNGNTDTSPIFSIRGPGTNFYVNNLTTGEQFRLTMSLLNNEVAVINTMTNRALLGSQNIFGSFSGDWMRLAPGINRINFRAGAGYSANTRLSISYNHAYLGT